MARGPRIDRELERYLVSGEKVIVAVRRHWFHLIREILLVATAAVLALWADVSAPLGTGGQALRNLTLLVFWLACGWLVWSVLNWRHDWFVATDKRFLLFYGFIRRKVAMMPLMRVTDMTFDRSLLGRIVGFGTFVLESAGQKQALSVIEHVPDADRHYRAICTQLFGPGSTLRVPGGWSGGPGGPPPTGPDDGAGPGGPGGGPGGGPVSGPDDGTGTSTVTPAASVQVRRRRELPDGPVRVSGRGHPRPPAQPEPESWYRSSNLGPSRLGDTGEIPVIRVGRPEDADQG